MAESAGRSGQAPRRVSPALSRRSRATRGDGWRGGGASSSFRLQIFLQGDGVVVRFVMRAVDERDRAPSRCRYDGSPGLGLGVEFPEVPAAKFRPFLRVVAEPLSKLGARADVLAPLVEVQRRFRNAARPQPLDEEARAIGGRDGIVGAFQFQHRTPQSYVIRRAPQARPRRARPQTRLAIRWFESRHRQSDRWSRHRHSWLRSAPSLGPR